MYVPTDQSCAAQKTYIPASNGDIANFIAERFAIDSVLSKFGLPVPDAATTRTPSNPHVLAPLTTAGAPRVGEIAANGPQTQLLGPVQANVRYCTPLGTKQFSPVDSSCGSYYQGSSVVNQNDGPVVTPKTDSNQGLWIAGALLLLLAAS